MSGLVRYEAAVKALAECKAVDEVKAWADKAAAMQAYGKMAKDKTLEVDAAEIRIRAERRLGELLAQQKAGGGLAKGVRMGGRAADGSAVVVDDRRETPTLGDVGISKDLSSRAQKLAAVPHDEFEAELAAKRERDQTEGARVSARLEKRGEEIQKANAYEPPESFGPDDAEIAASLAAEEADRKAMDLLLAADDKLAAAYTEIKRLNGELAVVKGQRDAYMNRSAELLRQIGAMKREARRAA